MKTTTGETSSEIAYGVTSLTAAAAPPTRLLQLNRGHWGIENGLHYRRDVTLHEDAGRSTVTAFGHIMATLGNLVIGLTIGRKWTSWGKPALLRAHPNKALQLLFAQSRRTL